MLFIASIIGMLTESGIRSRNKAIFFKSKAFIDRNKNSGYPLIPSINEFLLQKPLKRNPISEKAALDIFSFSKRTLKFLDARVYYNSYYKHCIWSNQQFFQYRKSWEDDKIIYLFNFESGIDSIDRIFIASIIGMFTESGIGRRNKANFFQIKSINWPQYNLILSTHSQHEWIFVAEAFKTKPNIGKSSIGYFFVFEERTLKFQEARVSIIIHIISIVS